MMVKVSFGSKADQGEARSIAYQAVLYACARLVPWELLAWPMPTTPIQLT